MDSSSGATIETLKLLVAAFNSHDLDDIMEFFGDDCVMEMPAGAGPGGLRLCGKNEVRAGVASRFEGLPDAYYGDDRHWVAGNFGVSEWTLSATRPSGERLNVRGCDHFEFRDGKIAVKNSFWKIIG
ncbi:MAG: nuclear transport factor 2 family protein [Dehalococcoidia bacterium]|jgi:ketosteroid isomerase-like protein|nr:nuclear transport factor 2 family protein [Dehalococcoidia bacterium]